MVKMRNPKLLCLLRKGCEIIFPSDYFFRGLPEDNYIQVGYKEGEYETKDGLWPMNEEGLESALKDEEKWNNDLTESYLRQEEEQKQEM
jgi:hypothetical protein